MAKIKSDWERVVEAPALTADWVSLAGAAVEKQSLAATYRVATSMPRLLLAATLSASSTSLNPEERGSSVTKISPMVVEANDQLSQSVRKSIRSMTKLLSQVTAEELTYEYRTAAIGAIADYVRDADPVVYEDAVRRFIGADAIGVPEETSAALIRYLSVQDLATPGIVSSLLTSMESGSEHRAVAAARTLGDVADKGVLPRLDSSLKRSKFKRVKEEGLKAAKLINYASSENS